MEQASEEVPRWKSYYERNKEKIREKNLQRYYDKKKANLTPEQIEAESKKQDRLAELVNELRTLIPTMIKPPRKKNKRSIVETIVESVE